MLLLDNKNFMEMFQEIAESQQKQEENKDAYATAEALEKLSVGGEKSEEKAVAPAKEAAAPAEETKAELKKDDKEKGEDSSAWFMVYFKVWYLFIILRKYFDSHYFGRYLFKRPNGLLSSLLSYVFYLGVEGF